MKFNVGDKFIYAGEDSEYSYLEFLGYQGLDFFSQRIYLSNGESYESSTAYIKSFRTNIEDGIWIPATPLLMELI